jgi:hypothetical protein
MTSVLIHIARTALCLCPTLVYMYSASYYTLLNLFGEFPLISELSTAGRVIALVTAVIAVAVVAIPTGILGNGFSDKVLQKCSACLYV